MSNLVMDAMRFAREVHKKQYRKYTGNPYADHLAEVAGIVSCVDSSEITLACTWLHDCVEDQNITSVELLVLFGAEVTEGVLDLSDLELGNRATRKALSRKRLANAPTFVQNIKVADLISNTSSICQHDPKFAKVYLDEKEQLLNVLTKANKDLVSVAREQITHWKGVLYAP